MNGKIFWVALAVFISSSCLAFTDSLWIVGAEGYPGDLVTVEVWLQYEGGGPSDSMSAFAIPLGWCAGVCSAEAITIGQDFVDAGLTDLSKIDNSGTDGPPPVPKIGMLVIPFDLIDFVERGTHLAATVDVRILSSAARGDSACFDTLMQAFPSSLFPQYVDKQGIHTYIPSFFGGCVAVIPCTCGDANDDTRTTVADALYISTYVYRGGDDPICEGDVNLDGRITIADATYLVNYIYRDGPVPCNPPSTSSENSTNQYPSSMFD